MLFKSIPSKCWLLSNAFLHDVCACHRVISYSSPKKIAVSAKSVPMAIGPRQADILRPNAIADVRPTLYRISHYLMLIQPFPPYMFPTTIFLFNLFTIIFLWRACNPIFLFRQHDCCVVFVSQIEATDVKYVCVLNLFHIILLFPYLKATSIHCQLYRFVNTIMCIHRFARVALVVTQVNIRNITVKKPAKVAQEADLLQKKVRDHCGSCLVYFQHGSPLLCSPHPNQKHFCTFGADILTF